MTYNQLIGLCIAADGLTSALFTAQMPAGDEAGRIIGILMASILLCLLVVGAIIYRQRKRAAFIPSEDSGKSKGKKMFFEKHWSLFGDTETAAPPPQYQPATGKLYWLEQSIQKFQKDLQETTVFKDELDKPVSVAVSSATSPRTVKHRSSSISSQTSKYSTIPPARRSQFG